MQRNKSIFGWLALALVAFLLLSAFTSAAPARHVLAQTATPVVLDNSTGAVVTDTAAPATDEPIDSTTLDFLKSLLTPIGAGVLASMLLSWWPWYQAQDSDNKTRIAVLFTAGIGVAAQLIITYVPVSFWQAIGPYAKLLASAFVAYGGSQLWFKKVEKTPDPATNNYTVNNPAPAGPSKV